MDNAFSHLQLYCPDAFSILYDVAVCRRQCELAQTNPGNVHDANVALRRLFALADQMGFDGNVWQSYLTCEILTNENPYSLACERAGDPGGTLSRLARRDMERFLRLFRFDFAEFETAMGIPVREDVLHYETGPGRKENPEGRRIQDMRDRLAACGGAAEALALVSGFYRDYGAGMFAFDHAFSVTAEGELSPVQGLPGTLLEDLVGYETQKKALRDNTEAFLSGREANHVLLYGDAGTGKSTCVRALLNEYPDSGLRLIELRRSGFSLLPELLPRLRERNYRFILFIDDLSFEEHETEYKQLKAAIEGGLETLPENVLIYATSNRRHLVRETWRDRNDMEHSGDIHRSDTVEEKLSLASRFGVAINFSAPDRRLYHEIVRALAKKRLPPDVDEEALLLGANAWEIRHGGVSGRTAQQYIDYLAGKSLNE